MYDLCAQYYIFTHYANICAERQAIYMTKVTNFQFKYLEIASFYSFFNSTAIYVVEMYKFDGKNVNGCVSP